MTEAPQLAPALNAWLEGWEKCLQMVLSMTTGETVAFEASAEALPRADSDLWFTVAVGGAVQGEMALRLPCVTGIRLAQSLLQETEPPPDVPTSNHKDALEELLRQVAGQAATSLSSTVGGGIQLSLASSAAPSWSPSGTKNLHTKDEAGTPVDIEIQVSAALATALVAPPKVAPPAPVAALSPAQAPLEGTGYERLRDVMLDVKLRFGSRRMLLRDVLALSAGVVVELDSNVTSPVDLLLDGRLVARGDVVVVDGKYGLRVTQVLDSSPPA